MSRIQFLTITLLLALGSQLGAGSVSVINKYRAEANQALQDIAQSTDIQTISNALARLKVIEANLSSSLGIADFSAPLKPRSVPHNGDKGAYRAEVAADLQRFAQGKAQAEQHVQTMLQGLLNNVATRGGQVTAESFLQQIEETLARVNHNLATARQRTAGLQGDAYQAAITQLRRDGILNTLRQDVRMLRNASTTLEGVVARIGRTLARVELAQQERQQAEARMNAFQQGLDNLDLAINDADEFMSQVDQAIAIQEDREDVRSLTGQVRTLSVHGSVAGRQADVLSERGSVTGRVAALSERGSVAGEHNDVLSERGSVAPVTRRLSNAGSIAGLPDEDARSAGGDSVVTL